MNVSSTVAGVSPVSEAAFSAVLNLARLMADGATDAGAVDDGVLGQHVTDPIIVEPCLRDAGREPAILQQFSKSIFR